MWIHIAARTLSHHLPPYTPTNLPTTKQLPPLPFIQVVLRLTSLPLWAALSPGRRALELEAFPQLKRHWQHHEQQQAKAKAKAKVRIDSWRGFGKNKKTFDMHGPWHHQSDTPCPPLPPQHKRPLSGAAAAAPRARSRGGGRTTTTAPPTPAPPATRSPPWKAPSSPGPSTSSWPWWSRGKGGWGACTCGSSSASSSSPSTCWASSPRGAS